MLIVREQRRSVITHINDRWRLALDIEYWLDLKWLRVERDLAWDHILNHLLDTHPLEKDDDYGILLGRWKVWTLTYSASAEEASCFGSLREEAPPPYDMQYVPTPAPLHRTRNRLRKMMQEDGQFRFIGK